jgi:hypothetical protein
MSSPAVGHEGRSEFKSERTGNFVENKGPAAEKLGTKLECYRKQRDLGACGEKVAENKLINTYVGLTRAFRHA